MPVENDATFDTLLARIETRQRTIARRAWWLTLPPLLIGIAMFVYSGVQARAAASARAEAQRLQQDVRRLADSVSVLEGRAQGLLRTQEGVLDFLGGVTAAEDIRLIDVSVDWDRTKRHILAMAPGVRKTAILTAVLLAWKELPFSLENRGLGRGLDSPHFIGVVLSRLGVRVGQRRDERLSDAMMRQFQRVASPLPGDLIFYRGNVGSFVVMYIGPGAPNGKGVAVGTLQTGEEVQVLDTANINTPVYPFIGFFRVPYSQ